MSSPSNENPFSTTNGGMHSSNGSHPKLTSNQDDLFGLDLTNGSNINNSNTIPLNCSSASDDLLMLTGANPFIQNIVNQSYAIQQTNPTMNPFQSNGKIFFINFFYLYENLIHITKYLRNNDTRRCDTFPNKFVPAAEFSK